MADDRDDGTNEREILTWEGFGAATRELAQTIVDSGFEPEIVIAVARGGMVPGGALTYALDVKLTDAINVEFYTGIAQTLPDPVLLAPLLDTESIRGRRLLVIDLLRRYGADVRSAVLYSKPTTVIAPDYSWRDTDRWIAFPWSAQDPVTRRA